MIDWNKAARELEQEGPTLTPSEPRILRRPDLHPKPPVCKHGQSPFTTTPPHPSRRP